MLTDVTSTAEGCSMCHKHNAMHTILESSRKHYMDVEIQVKSMWKTFKTLYTWIACRHNSLQPLP